MSVSLTNRTTLFTYPAARLGRLARVLPVWLLALMGYTLLALVLTWPLALHLHDRFPGYRPDDAWGHYWNLWWFKLALSTGQNPYHTPLWYPPEGTELYVGTLAPINGILGLLPQLLAGPLVAYNVVVLLNIALAGFTTFLLARHVTGHTGGAAVAGLCVAASPYLIGELNMGHLNVSVIYGIPLFAYALLRAADGGVRYIPLAALAFLTTILGEWQTGISALLLAGILLSWQTLAALRRQRPWGAPLRMIVGGILSGLVALPLVIPTVQAINAAGPTAAMGERLNSSINLLAFIVPQELHPLWGEVIRNWLRENLWQPRIAAIGSLGLTVLALALLGSAHGRRAALPWLVALVVGIGLSVGPDLHIGHTAYPIPTLFTVLGALPYMDVSRNPGRFVVLATLGIALLAAFGVRWLAGVLNHRQHSTFVVGLVGLLVLGEMWRAPFPLSLPPDTEVAQRIGREIAGADPAGAVLPIPYKSYEQHILFHQVHHGRPIYSTGGAIERLPVPPLRTNTPGFADLVRNRPYRDIFQPAADPLAVLNAFHVRYVLFYPEEVADGERGQYHRALRRVLQQPAPTYVSSDGRLEAWRVPSAASGSPFLRTGDGWHGVETWQGIGDGRWLRGEGTLYLERPTPTPVTLTFAAVSFGRPRHLEIRADGHLLSVVEVAVTPTDVILSLPPGQGRTSLTLQTVEGVSREDQEAFGDKRPLTVGIADVRLTPTATP